MEQLRLAICDDEAVDLTRTMELVKAYDSSGRLHMTTFVRSTDLLELSRQAAFDIVLMDIEMEPLCGFDAAKELITLAHPPVILFTTKSNAYTVKGYGIAIRYLQKPLDPESLFEALDAAVSEAFAHKLTIQVDNTIHAIPLRDVQYIEVFGHYAVIHTDKESYRFRSTLKDILAKLPQGYFVSTHKSYLVNLEHIRSATASQAHLDGGACIPISRSRQQEFNQALYRFLGR